MRGRRLALAALTAVALSAWTGLAGAAPPAPGTTAVAWEACPPSSRLDPRQECAKLPVPLDYGDPAGETIDVAISRIQTAKPELRRGVLLFNPGGPGSSGLNGPSRLAATLPPEVLDRYDLVGFDPRGIAYSAPVSCALAPSDMDVLKFIPYPAHDLDISDNVAYAARVAAGCGETSGELLPHISTANTARDMDRIRVALGEQRISYIGYSYGSYLGSVYAALFPERTDRFVVDSIVHPQRGTGRATWAAWGASVEVAFRGFAEFAAARDAEFGLGATPEAVHAKVVALAKELEEDPFDHPAGIVIGGDAFRELIRNDGLRNDRSFPGLGALIALIDARDEPAAAARSFEAAPLVPQADPIPSILGAPALGAPGPGTADFPAPPEDNLFTSTWAVVCGDQDWPADPAVYQRDVRLYERLFPLHGRAAANIWPCAFWPSEPSEPTVAIGPLRGGKALIVQSVRDPATPLDGAVALRATFGSRSRLVTVQDGAHSISFNRINRCADAHTAAFLADGTLPASDRHCARDAG